jgi:plasmid stabilization system protein ParE
MKIRFSESAAADYDDVLGRLYSVNPFAARRFADAVGQSMRRIARYPRMGHRVPEHEQLPIRQFIVEPYRFFYLIDDRKKLVLVVDVWHGAQIPAEPHLPASEPEPAQE